VREAVAWFIADAPGRWRWWSCAALTPPYGAVAVRCFSVLRGNAGVRVEWYLFNPPKVGKNDLVGRVLTRYGQSDASRVVSSVGMRSFA